MSELNDHAKQVRARWAEARLFPLWESPNAHKPPPVPQRTHAWRWTEIRPLLQLALEETSPAAVERRVLQLISPYSQSRDDEFTAGMVLAAVQCLLPGEVARPHRHTMNALRFVLEGSGAETLVDGKPCRMEFGDLILTPAMCWHEHRHHGSEPVLWLDVLDVPLHNWLGTAVFQPGPVHEFPPTLDDDIFTAAGVQPLRLGASREHSPMFRYAYQDVVRALQKSPAMADGSRRVRYVDPVSGKLAMPMLECQMWQLDPDQPTAPERSNANAVCLVVEGNGRSRIGDDIVEWGPLDILTLPQDNWLSHTASSGPCRLFVITDRDVLGRLGILREETRSPTLGNPQ